MENGNCSYNNSAGACCNSQAQPGLFIVRNGTVSFGGNIIFWGIVYAANVQSLLLGVVSLNGTAAVNGGVMVDGDSGLVAGSSKVNIVCFDGAFSSITSYGTAGLVQNRWREIPANT